MRGVQKRLQNDKTSAMVPEFLFIADLKGHLYLVWPFFYCAIFAAIHYLEAA